MEPDLFRVCADISTVFDVPIEKNRLMAFLSNPDTFEKYMPSVNSIKPKGKSESGNLLFEWEYEIEMPLSSPIKLPILTEYYQREDTFFHTAIQNGQSNLMNCSLAFKYIQPEQTYVTMELTINLHRKSGIELHPLGILMGENFMSIQMKNKMQSIVTEFLQNAVNALGNNQAA